MFSTPIEAVDPSGTAVTPAIERAVDANGSLYTALPVAYAYRKGFTQACSCRSTASGLPRIPLSADPTLRDGDIVVTPDGLRSSRAIAQRRTPKRSSCPSTTQGRCRPSFGNRCSRCKTGSPNRAGRVSTKAHPDPAEWLPWPCSVKAFAAVRARFRQRLPARHRRSGRRPAPVRSPHAGRASLPAMRGGQSK